VTRLHTAFVTHILNHGPDTFWEIREALRNIYKLPIPEAAPDGDYTPAQHRKAFLAFAEFVRGNLGGQTGLRVDPAWASQTEVLHGFAQVLVPDMVLREDDLALGLNQLAAQVGLNSPDVAPIAETRPVPLSDIYDDAVEEAVRAAYQKDYMMFGFRALNPDKSGAPFI
jgi:hypothetical protein